MDVKAIEKLTTDDRVFTFSPVDLRKAHADLSLINKPDQVVEAIFLKYHQGLAEGENRWVNVACADNGDVFDRVPIFFIFASREDAREAVMKAIDAKVKEFTNRYSRWLGETKDMSPETT